MNHLRFTWLALWCHAWGVGDVQHVIICSTKDAAGGVATKRIVVQCAVQKAVPGLAHRGCAIRTTLNCDLRIEIRCKHALLLLQGLLPFVSAEIYSLPQPPPFHRPEINSAGAPFRSSCQK